MQMTEILSSQMMDHSPSSCRGQNLHLNVTVPYRLSIMIIYSIKHIKLILKCKFLSENVRRLFQLLEVQLLTLRLLRPSDDASINML